MNLPTRRPRGGPSTIKSCQTTSVTTWSGFVYVTFVIGVSARRIVGWRVSRTAHAAFVLDALEQALHERRPHQGGGLVHPSDRGSQDPSIRDTERLAEAGVEPSVGSLGDSDDNALAETIDGLFEAEVIHRRGPWRSFEAVEFATLEWVDGFNTRRRLERQQPGSPEGDDDRLLLRRQNRRARLLRSHDGVDRRVPIPPPLHGGRADAVALGRGSHALLT